MGETMSVDEMGSGAFRVVEAVLFLPLALLVVAGIVWAASETVLGQYTGTALSQTGFTVGAVCIPLSTIAALVLPGALYVDSARVRAATDGLDRSPVSYAILGFVFNYLIALWYVTRRHELVADRVGTGRWWPLVAVGAVGPLVGVVLAFLTHPSTLGTGLSLGFVLVTMGIFPIAIYRDAVYVRGGTGNWQPNPGSYFLAGMALVFLAPVSFLLLGGSYLRKRRNAFQET